MRSLFMAFTPYQCVNSTALALSNVENESDIVLMEWGNKSDKQLIDNLHKVFKNVYIISNINRLRQSKEWSMKDYYLYTKNIRKLVKKLKGQQYSKIYASSENHLYVQFILKKLVRNNVKYYHYEDGSFEYSSHVEKSKGLTDNIARIQQGILFGFYKKLYNFPGQADGIEKLYLLYPELRRLELANQEAEKINQNLFCKSLEILYPDVISIDKGVIICLDLSERGEDIIDLNQKVYNIVQSQTDNVYLKYHPREFTNNYYIKSDVEVNIIDSYLPIECVLKNFKGVMVSNLSSILHVLTFMNPNVDIICTAYLDSEIKDKAYIDMLTKLNVKMPKTDEELARLLKSMG
ncbi:Uncharacterised protein [Turicibacter sanguinis]|nr:Uncharacterised protein [Turicibacter sanguinis]